MINYNDTCQPHASGCYRTSLPNDLCDRMRQLVFSESMLTLSHFLEIIEEMKANLTTKQDLIIAGALSDNHFKEAQVVIDIYILK